MKDKQTRQIWGIFSYILITGNNFGILLFLKIQTHHPKGKIPHICSEILLELAGFH